MSSNRPAILFFNINGLGLGHLSTCLAYAHRIRDHARPVFFSLAPAIEKIHDMGFEADYLVSPSWSRAANRHWNKHLALRLGMLLERVRPKVLVFDGTWPFHGLLFAAGARRITLTALGILQYIAPTIQFSLGVLLYHEPLTTARLVGFVLIWLACAVYTIESIYHSRVSPRRHLASIQG